jgi:hypothetical protein
MVSAFGAGFTKLLSLTLLNCEAHRQLANAGTLARPPHAMQFRRGGQRPTTLSRTRISRQMQTAALDTADKRRPEPPIRFNRFTRISIIISLVE